MLHRNGLFDFYEFFLPLLYQYFALRDTEISTAAFNVIEEISGDEGGLSSLLRQQQSNIIDDLQKKGDMFAAKFLRSDLGF
jgi:hypothetical protein